MALSGLKDLFRGFVGNFSATAAQEDDFFSVSSGGESEQAEITCCAAYRSCAEFIILSHSHEL